jgi:hypothetical protein
MLYMADLEVCACGGELWVPLYVSATPNKHRVPQGHGTGLTSGWNKLPVAMRSAKLHMPSYTSLHEVNA